MLKFEDVLLDVERELEGTPGIRRAVKFGITYALVRQAIQTYTDSDAPETSTTALTLMRMLLESGALQTMLSSHDDARPRTAPRPEAQWADTQRAQTQHAPAAPPSTRAPLGEEEIRRLAAQLNLTPEETDALVRSAGILDPGEEAVITHRADEDLAREELFRSNPLNGVAGFSEPPPDFSTRDADDLTGLTQ